MEKTKEELIRENAVLIAAIEEWNSNDEKRKIEFAKAFHWNKRKGPYDQYDSEQSPLLPSWSEIFVEIGKLLACRDFRDYEGNISELECKLETLENNIRSEVHPNLPIS